MGRSLGKGLREFKSSISGKEDDDHQALPVATSARTEEPAAAAPRDRDSIA